MTTTSHEPLWKSWLVLLSMATDPVFLRFRVHRAWAKLTGARRPEPPLPPAGPPREGDADLESLEVDLVYLWVSGQDADLVRERHEWLRRCGLPAEVFNPDVRYVEHDELRYSLRSVERFLPWVRRVFVVTNGQVPGWLERRNTRVRLVRHTEIFPDPSWLPTFNSVAIEAQLHHIPDLAEHFLYANDDCFIGRPCTKADFFAGRDGGQGAPMRVVLSERWITPAHRVTGDPLGRLLMYSYNSLKLALESRRPWQKVRHLDCHQAQPMVKARLEEATRGFGRLYRHVSASRFRNPEDVNFLVLTRYRALQRGQAVHGSISRRFFRREEELDAFDETTLPALFCVNEGRAPAGWVPSGRWHDFSLGPRASSGPPRARRPPDRRIAARGPDAVAPT